MTDTSKDLERTRKLKEMEERGFSEWLTQPTSRLLISTIPAGEHQETLMTILRSAFDAGKNIGSAGIALLLLEGMLDKRPPLR